MKRITVQFTRRFLEERILYLEDKVRKREGHETLTESILELNRSLLRQLTRTNVIVRKKGSK